MLNRVPSLLFTSGTRNLDQHDPLKIMIFFGDSKTKVFIYSHHHPWPCHALLQYLGSSVIKTFGKVLNGKPEHI